MRHIITRASLVQPKRFAGFVLLVLAAFAIAGCGGSGGGGGENGGNAASGECEDYPSRDVEFIVPFSAGGGYDAWSRLLAPFISENLPNDVNVVVRNVPGASGLTGANQLYAAQPDGHTIEIMTAAGLSGAALGGGADFEVDEFTYLATVTLDSRPLVVAGDSPINDVEELEGAAPLTQATTGYNAGDGVASIIVYDVFGIDYELVVHDGNSEALLSVIRGDSDAAFSATESALDQMTAGELKPILTAGRKPEEGEPGYEELEDVPTLSDLGHPELDEGALDTQYLIGAPPELPDCVRDTLEQAIMDSLNDPEFIKQAEESGRTPRTADAAETTEYVQQTVDTYAEYEDVIRTAIERNQ